MTWISNVGCRCLLVFNDFILALELMSTAIKNDTSINGMKINNSEYLLILEICLECAGLSANLEKIEAIWIRSKVHSKERLLPGKDLKLNQSGKL